MRILGLLLLASSVVAQAPSEEPPAGRPVGSTSELMVNIIYPTSDAIFYISTRTPKNAVEWNAVRNQAQMLGESANLLMMPGRARDQNRWMDDSKLLLDVGIAAFRAAKAKDVEALTALNDQLYTSCVTCHAHYRPNYRRPAAAPAPQTATPQPPSSEK